jgi:tetratricopeptide (TPR) repeat protein
MALLKGLKSYLADAEKQDIPDRKANDLRSQADRERDAENWDKAAELYQKYLDYKPDDFPIWVQRGNCLKEAGNFAAAEQAYRIAITLKPDDPDVHLQLGHLMKRTGQIATAIECYQRSFKLDPTLQYAHRELKALRVNVRVEDSPTVANNRRTDVPIHYFDIFDIISFLTAHTRVTGIQRVVIGIISAYLENNRISDNIEYCAVSKDGENLNVFEKRQLRYLLDYLTMPEIDRNILDELLTSLIDNAAPAQLRANDIFVILGAFWIVRDYGVWLLRLKEKGVIIGTYIYDLIPVTHPQFVTESNFDAVNERYAEVLLLSDFFLTISEYVAERFGHC